MERVARRGWSGGTLDPHAIGGAARGKEDGAAILGSDRPGEGNSNGIDISPEDHREQH